MALFAIPFLYGIKEDFFCPWSQIPVHVELYSYCLRGLVVPIFAVFFSKHCVIEKAP